jgi:hypothetical protein
LAPKSQDPGGSDPPGEGRRWHLLKQLIPLGASLIIGVIVVVIIIYSVAERHRVLDSILGSIGVVVGNLAVAINVRSTIRKDREAVNQRIGDASREKILSDIDSLCTSMDLYEDYARIFARRLIGAVAISAAEAALVTQVLHKSSPSASLSSVYLALVAFVISGIVSLTTPGRIREAPPISTFREKLEGETSIPVLQRWHTQARQLEDHAWFAAVIYGTISVFVFLLLLSSLVLFAVGQHLTR